MKLTVNRSLFVDNILSPASKLTDNISLQFKENSVSALVASPDNSVVLLASVPCKITGPAPCIIPDCKTFLRLFSGIEGGDMSINIENNLISHDSKSFSFKYHLLDEQYFGTKKSISEEKIDALSFDTTFCITKGKFSEILKFNSIIPEAEKLYFSTKGEQVVAKLGDEQKCNANEIVTDASGAFEGLPIEDRLPVNIQSLLLLSFSTDVIEVSINQKLKIFRFKTPTIRYIISGLIK